MLECWTHLLLNHIADPLEEMEEASYLLQLYEDDWSLEISRGQPDFRAIKNFRGPFAFVLYDRRYGSLLNNAMVLQALLDQGGPSIMSFSCHRIIAGRDAEGEEPLYWGSASLSEGILFASDQ